MSVAASGKSTFAAAHPRYRGYKLVDFAQLMPRSTPLVKLVLYLSRAMPRLGYLARNSAFVRAKRRGTYYEQVFSYIRGQTEHVVVLGRQGPDDLRPYSDIVFGVVLIPSERHKDNTRRRKQELLNPLPFLHHWTTDFRRVAAARARLLQYAQRQGLPVFTSFDQAIDNLSAAAPDGAPAQNAVGNAVSGA